MRATAVRAFDFGISDAAVRAHPESAARRETIVGKGVEWSQEGFAAEQIRGLVQQLFSPAFHPPVQQIVFSAVEAQTDVRSLCTWVGEAVAEEKSVEVAVIDESETCRNELPVTANVEARRRLLSSEVRQFATIIRKNVWAFPSRGAWLDSPHVPLCAYLAELRRDFEYSIVAAPASTISSKALEMARLADGIVLVLSAQHTRRATALKVRDALSHVRLLGTLLMDREFPIPNGIYRRL